jgi:hypothetical protein
VQRHREVHDVQREREANLLDQVRRLPGQRRVPAVSRTRGSRPLDHDPVTRASRPGPPDFVGVGAQRSGTTWWYELISAHPGVRTGEKERHYFNRFCTEEMGDGDIERYWASFPGRAGTITGEWTPRYAYDVWTPPLLRRAAPDAKLLFMVRDPIERLRSGVVHQCSLTPPSGPVELATIYAEAADRGRYGTQLSRLLQFFAREQILVLQYERALRDPWAALRATYEFLGLDPDVRPADLDRPRGTSSADLKPALPADFRAALVAELGGEALALATLAPDLDLSLWPWVAPVAG